MKPLPATCLLAAHLLAANVVAAGTEIFDAVRAGEGEKVKTLLQADPKLVEARTEDGSTALHLAALDRHADIVRYLLAHQAQVNARGLRDETPLHMAMYEGHREVAEVLLAGQADVNAQNIAGETPLHLAARKGHRELAALLLDHQADVNAKDQQDATPLHAAAAAGHKELVELLLSHNADPAARDKAGRTPKAVAAEKEHWETMALLTPRVGDLYDVQRLVFEGAKTFPAEALRLALKNNRDFFEVSHPMAPQDAYLEDIQRKLVLGYRHHGFPEAQVEARHDPKAGRIIVKVEEGPRYVCGAVKVSGAQTVPAAEILEQLTPSQATTQAVERAFEFMNKPKPSPSLAEAGLAEIERVDPFWVKGEPAPFSEVDQRRIKTLATSVLRGHGFLSAKVEVQVVPDKGSRTAELQVNVLAEGPRAVIDRIDVVGNKTNTAEAILHYLGLRPGMELSRHLASTIEDRLWRSARFLSNNVSLGPADASGRVPVQVQVCEFDQAPPLSQEFSREDRAMLKLREWLSKLDQGGEDMVIRFTGMPRPFPEVECVLSPAHGLTLLAQDASGAAARDEYAVVFKAGQVGFYSPAGSRKMLLPCPGTQLWGSIVIESHPPDSARGPFFISMGAGFSRQPGDTSATPGFQLKLELPPVACVGLARRWDCASWFDGDVLIRSNATVLVKINASTGRLLECQAAGTNRDTTVHLRFEADAYLKAVQGIEARTARLPDVCDTNAPISSAVAFVVEETLSSRYLAPVLRTNMAPEVAGQLPALLRQFRLASVLAPLDQLLPDPEGLVPSNQRFAIPEDLEYSEVARSGYVGLVASWLLRRSDQMFAPHSWPWTLLREAGLTVQHKARYSDQALQEVADSSETGPCGLLAVAEVLSKVQPPLARQFAVRGLERLSVADFRHDYRLFLAGGSVLSQCCQRLAAVLRELDSAQLDALTKQQPPVRAEFIRDCARRLRAAKDQPVLDTLAPALDAYWEQEMKGQVATLLRALAVDPATAFKEGLAAYQTSSPDKSQAAKLFKQAAAYGHPAAQYYLGMIYERGAGVPKDISAALNWYRQSAMKGFDEAAVTLGNLYSDGLELKPDYAEAFIWYSVAAAQGNPMAKTFRNTAQRKLTAPQLAEAQKKLADILRDLPAAGRASPPSRDADR